MKGRNRFSVLFAALVPVLLLVLLSGCGGSAVTPAPAEAAGGAEPVGPAESEEASAAGAKAGRQDGERFEEIIILEGMEEAVRYEHVRNDAIGFEMDYDYERFERRSEADRECFISRYDDPDEPENYLEVTFIPRDAETVAEAISAVLSLDYDIGRDDSFQLERAGRCIRIDASNAKGNGGTPDLLQMVYIVPAADGCRVATAHYSFESAEGFGRRFHYFMDSFTVIAGQGEKKLSEEQALAAIRRYCLVGNPELGSLAEAGEYPVYWEITSGDEQALVVLFRSYTGAQIRYTVDPRSGDTGVTEFVPGISAEETQTDEQLNAWDYAY